MEASDGSPAPFAIRFRAFSARQRTAQIRFAAGLQLSALAKAGSPDAWTMGQSSCCRPPFAGTPRSHEIRLSFDRATRASVAQAPRCTRDVTAILFPGFPVACFGPSVPHRPESSGRHSQVSTVPTRKRRPSLTARGAASSLPGRRNRGMIIKLSSRTRRGPRSGRSKISAPSTRTHEKYARRLYRRYARCERYALQSITLTPDATRDAKVFGSTQIARMRRV